MTKSTVKRIAVPKKDPFFTNPANLAHFQKSVKQKENGEVVELTKGEWRKLLLS